MIVRYRIRYRHEDERQGVECCGRYDDVAHFERWRDVQRTYGRVVEDIRFERESPVPQTGAKRDTPLPAPPWQPRIWTPPTDEQERAIQAAFEGRDVTDTDWQPISTAPQSVAVLTKIDDARGVRNEAELVRVGNLWFFSDMSMYVYYTPTHWMPLPASPPESTRGDEEPCGS